MLDFGMSGKLGSEGHMTPLTAANVMRWYRAPELLGRSKHYSKMVDMWAAGTVAAEMDRGTSVFTGDAEPEALSRMISVLDRPTFSPMAEDITGIMKEATLVVGHPPKKLARRRRTRPVRRFL